MRRNCNLTLRLVPPCSDHREEESTGDVDLLGEDRNENKNQNQQLTIFYEGRISICDVTDLQARAIIKLASEEIKEEWRSRRTGSTSSSPSSPFILSTSPSSPFILSPSPSPSLSPGGLSMKRSLKSFLQKRNHRIQTASPYHH